MKTYSITLTKDELDMLWCIAHDNVKYWKDTFVKTKETNEVYSDYRMYHIARTAFNKLHRKTEGAIIRTLKGFSHNKYNFIWKGGEA